MSTVLSCPACGRPVVDPDASFCAGCGAALTPPVTVPAAPAPPAAVAPTHWPPPPPPPPAASARHDDAEVVRANRSAAFMAIAGSTLVLIGAFQTWVRIRVAGFAPPGSAQTGWEGGDGRTIAVAAVAALIAAGAVVIGRRETWPKIVLLIAGAITAIIAVVNMVDAGSKAHDIEVQFGIPAEDVHAQLGIGLFLVLAGGLTLLAAGLRARAGS